MCEIYKNCARSYLWTHRSKPISIFCAGDTASVPRFSAIFAKCCIENTGEAGEIQLKVKDKLSGRFIGSSEVTTFNEGEMKTLECGFSMNEAAQNIQMVAVFMAESGWQVEDDYYGIFYLRAKGASALEELASR